jgi:adenosine deaminase
MNDNFLAIQEALDLSIADIQTLIRNGFEHSFSEKKVAFLEKTEAYFSPFLSNLK